MTDKNYNELLRKRVLQENKEFNEELEKLSANEALSRAYEKVIKEDLVCSIGERFYKQNGQIKAYPVKPKEQDMER